MNRWSFLSLAPKPWFLSLGMHLAFLGFILFINRTHTLDLSVVSLDMLTAKSAAASQPPPGRYLAKAHAAKNGPAANT